MNRAKAIQILDELKREAPLAYTISPSRAEAWLEKARFVLVASFGEEDDLVKKLNEITFTPQGHFSFFDIFFLTSDTKHAYETGLLNARSVIEIAILRLQNDAHVDPPKEQRDPGAYDPELWDEVQGLLIAEDWAKVASQAAIFFEDRLRRWAGHPEDRNGNGLYGKGLVSSVLGDQSPWRLGRNANEQEGWRALGTGFAQAIGNVDRHHRQERDDMKQYALGVLGLASLLLTQIRHEHGDLIADQQSVK